MPFFEASRTTANLAFAPFHKDGDGARASVWLRALDDLKEVQAELVAPPGWRLEKCPATLKQGSLTKLTLTAPLSLDGAGSVAVQLATPARRWRLTVPADAAVEKRRPYQVRQLSAYLEDRFRREREVYSGSTAAGFRRWQAERKRSLLGWLRQAITRPVRLEARVTERQEGPFCVRDKVLIRVEPDMWMPCFLVRPKNPEPGRRLTPILFCCGSGPGKAGMAPDETEEAQDPAGWTAWPSPYTMALQLQAVVLIPDRRGWGEWAEGNHNQRPQRAQAAGFSVTALEVWDHLRAVDYLASRPDVDPARLVCMGSSGGGYMTTWMTALHPGVTGGIISSAMTTTASLPPDFFQTMPSGPLPDIRPDRTPLCMAGIASLAAPKPLWIMDGLLDGIDNPHLPEAEKQEALRRFKAVQDEGRQAIQQAYELLGAADRCRTTWFEGGHLAGFHFNNIHAWLS
jgi:predicted esterase